MLLLPTSELFNGETKVGNDEEAFAECLKAKGVKGMAKNVREGRVHHQFAFLCTRIFVSVLEIWWGYLGD